MGMPRPARWMTARSRRLAFPRGYTDVTCFAEEMALDRDLVADRVTDSLRTSAVRRWPAGTVRRIDQQSASLRGNARGHRTRPPRLRQRDRPFTECCRWSRWNEARVHRGGPHVQRPL